MSYHPRPLHPYAYSQPAYAIQVPPFGPTQFTQREHSLNVALQKTKAQMAELQANVCADIGVREEYSQTIVSLTTQVSRLQEQTTSTGFRAEIAERHIQIVEREKEHLIAQNQVLAENNNTLTQRVAVLSHQNSGLTGRVEELTQANQALTRQNASLNAANRDLQQQIAQHKANIQELHSQICIMAATERRLANLLARQEGQLINVSPKKSSPPTLPAAKNNPQYKAQRSRRT